VNDSEHFSRRPVNGRRQLALIGALSIVYFGVRAVTANQETEAHANAADIVSLEKTFGLDVEFALHRAAMANEVVIRLFNWVYLWGHFPVLIGALIILWSRRHHDYTLLRNALIVSGAVGLMIFAIYPVAPPRLFAPATFFDSVHELSTSHRVLQNPRITNQYAAVPSFHVGWNLLVALALCRSTSRPALRALAAAMPVVMCLAVIATANHWLIDIVIGAAVALLGWATAAARTPLIDLRDTDTTKTPDTSLGEPETV